jgi:hypothetical protein
MFGNVFLKTMRDQRRTLLGWGVGIVLLVGIEVALWPSIRDMPDLENFLANYPEAMKELVNLDAMTTPSGFMNAELFTLVLPIRVPFGCGGPLWVDDTSWRGSSPTAGRALLVDATKRNAPQPGSGPCRCGKATGSRRAGSSSTRAVAAEGRVHDGIAAAGYRRDT